MRRLGIELDIRQIHRSDIFLDTSNLPTAAYHPTRKNADGGEEIMRRPALTAQQVISSLVTAGHAM